MGIAHKLLGSECEICIDSSVAPSVHWVQNEADLKGKRERSEDSELEERKLNWIPQRGPTNLIYSDFYSSAKTPLTEARYSGWKPLRPSR